MSDDKTEILMIDSLTGKKLTREQADIIVNRMQANTDSAARYDALESDLIEIVGVVNKIKKAVVWIIGILFANWIVTFHVSIDSLL